MAELTIQDTKKFLSDIETSHKVTSTDIAGGQWISMRSLAEQLLATMQENAKLREALQWRPIETAPMDGTRILGTDGQMVEVIYNARGTGWFNQSAEMSLWQAWPPTHWMPLPESPVIGCEYPVTAERTEP